MAKRAEAPETAVLSARVFRAKVLGVHEDRSVQVSALDGGREYRCDVLETSGAFPLLLAPGDDVLVWQPGRGRTRGVLLGRTGPGVDAARTKEVPDELVLEAKKRLVLRVGEGSITIRADGKILIKGKDLVSHAKRMNRIKGGAVSLN